MIVSESLPWCRLFIEAWEKRKLLITSTFRQFAKRILQSIRSKIVWTTWSNFLPEKASQPRKATKPWFIQEKEKSRCRMRRKARSSMRMQSNRIQCAGSCWCKKSADLNVPRHTVFETTMKITASVQGFERGKGTSVCGDEELAKMLRSSCKCRGDAINSISWLTCFVWHKLNSRCVSDGFWQNLCGLYHNALDSD